jgi:hypothetical protein
MNHPRDNRLCDSKGGIVNDQRKDSEWLKENQLEWLPK